jgi:hypothetical protein
MIVIALCSILINGPAFSQTVPVFEQGEILKFSNGTNLMPTGNQYFSVPCVVDWDGDGIQDLLGGYFYNGWVYFYKNVGSNSQPSFVQGNEILLQADGSTISVGYG